MTNTKNTSQQPDIGKQLKTARLDQKLTLEAVSKELCITKSTLKNLEENTAHLKQDVYVIGHIRAYAEFLHLNSDQIVQDFKLNADSAPKMDERNFIMPMPQESIPRSRILLGSAALALVVGYGIHYYSTPNSMNNELSARNHDTTNLPQEKIETLTEAPVMTLEVNEESWVEIRNLTGDVVISRIFNPGDSQVLNVTDDLILHTGNAGGVTLSFGDYKTPPLGESGEIIDHLSLKPEKLLAQYPKNQ